MSNIIVIEPGRQELNYWRDLWRYRELFYVLAWRDVAVRYKQTVIGAAWALIRPFLTMVGFSVIVRNGRISAQAAPRSEEHTSELQSTLNLVCRLLLEKKKNNYIE